MLAIERYRALDTDQVRALFFRHMAYGQRKAQERLLALHRRGKLQRHKLASGSYYYYLIYMFPEIIFTKNAKKRGPKPPRI